VSLRDHSPEVVSPDEAALITSDEISARLSTLKNAPAITQEPATQDNSTRFDLTTLYVTGLPKTRSDVTLKSLFLPFGRVRSIINLTSSLSIVFEIETTSNMLPGKEFGAAFVSFGNIEAPAKALQSFVSGRGSIEYMAKYARFQRDGQRFTLDGHTLHLKYKKFKPFIPKKNQNFNQGANTKTEYGIQQSPQDHSSHLEASSSPKGFTGSFPPDSSLSTDASTNSRGDIESNPIIAENNHPADTIHAGERQGESQITNQTDSTNVETTTTTNPSALAAPSIPVPVTDANTKTPVYLPYPSATWTHPYGQYGTYPYPAYHPMYAMQPYPQPYWVRFYCRKVLW
jgi:hypothetical protein